MRIAALALSVVFAAAAMAEETPPATPPAPDAAAVVEPVAAAPKARQKRYVNEKGETLVCKQVYGGTGSRLKNRGRIICGTQAEWDDANSDLSKYVTDLTSNFRGNPGN